MITLKAYKQPSRGYDIDDSLRWHSVALPESTGRPPRNAGYGIEPDPGAFLAIYVDKGAVWVQLNSRRWPAAKCHFSLERRNSKHVFSVQQDGAEVDELVYTPGWWDIPQAMLIEHADLGEEEFDLGRFIVTKCADPKSVRSFLAYRSQP